MTGLETSELLTEMNNDVSIIEMADKIAPNTWFQQLDDVIPKLINKNTQFLTYSKLIEINDKGIVTENTKTYKKTEIPCDLVVLSLGVKADNALYNEIKNEFSQVYNIGDSVKAGRIFNATESAYQLVKSIQ